MLKAVHQRAEADIERAKQRVGKMEEELEHLAEGALEEVEDSEEAAIRAKLGIDKKSE